MDRRIETQETMRYPRYPRYFVHANRWGDPDLLYLRSDNSKEATLIYNGGRKKPGVPWRIEEVIGVVRKHQWREIKEEEIVLMFG